VNKGFRGGDGDSSGYEPTTKVVSVVNSVEMEGVEKYLVVRDNADRGSGLMTRSCKSLDPNMKVRLYGIARNSTRPT
jgi:Ras family protein T1